MATNRSEIEQIMFDEDTEYNIGDNLEFDLHGYSVEKAKAKVLAELAKAPAGAKYRFITGRGNHILRDGRRGVLHSAFQGWIADSTYSDKISELRQYNGYYEIDFLSFRDEALFDPILFIQKCVTSSIQQNLDEIKKRASDGDPTSQLILGRGYEHRDYGMPRDYKKAASWYKRAADQGLPEAQLLMGHCYYHGRGVRLNDTKAWKYYNLAVENDLSDAHLHVGILYLNGLAGVDENHEKACSRFTRAAVLGNAVAFRKLATCYRHGFYFEVDLRKAFNNFKKAADLGDAFSQHNVAVMYQDGDVVKKNERSAFLYFKMAADNGDKDSLHCLAGCYYRGCGVEKNIDTGIKLYKKAAKAGSSQANFFLSRHFVAKDDRKSKYYLMQAGHSGHFLAQVMLFLASSHKDNEEDKTLTAQMAAALKKRSIKLFLQLDKKILFSLMINLFLFGVATNKQRNMGRAILYHYYKKHDNDADAVKLLFEDYIHNNQYIDANLVLLGLMARGEQGSLDMYLGNFFNRNKRDQLKWLKLLTSQAEKGDPTSQWLLICIMQIPRVQQIFNINVEKFRRELVMQDDRKIAELPHFLQLYIISLLFSYSDKILFNKGAMLLEGLSDNYPDAYYYLMLYASKLYPQGSGEAFDRLSKGVEAGSIYCKTAMGAALLTGAGLELERERGLTYLEETATLGDPKALYILAEYYYSGEIFNTNLKKSVELIEKIKQSNLENYAKNLHSGIFCYIVSSDATDRLLGLIYLQGSDKVSSQPELAIKLLTPHMFSDSKPDFSVIEPMVQYYFNTNPQRAYDILCPLADAGYSYAMYQLYLLSKQSCSFYSSQEGKCRLQDAADAGHPTAAEVLQKLSSVQNTAKSALVENSFLSDKHHSDTQSENQQHDTKSFCLIS